MAPCQALCEVRRRIFCGPMISLRTLDITSWTGLFLDALRVEAIDALEHGRVLAFPNLPFGFEAREKTLLTSTFSNGKSKNVSFQPSGEMGGTPLTGEDRGVLMAMIACYARTATDFVLDLLPHYRGRLEPATTSYRPVEIEGRPASAIHDDTRLHIDAFPSRPMRGRRIMRLFTNVDPNGASGTWESRSKTRRVRCCRWRSKVLPRMPGCSRRSA